MRVSVTALCVIHDRIKGFERCGDEGLNDSIFIFYKAIKYSSSECGVTFVR